jgi:DNA-directed RNA polymerase specialized sigma24 family protein
MPHSFTVADRQKAASAEAREKAREAVAHRQRLEREDVLLLRRRGMVPLAIADEVGISLSRVVRYLNDAGEKAPSYLTTWGEARLERTTCPHCGSGV